MRGSCPRCKIALAREREVKRHVDTTEGWVGYGRMRYTCRRCGKGQYPFDFRLEVSKDSRMNKRKEKKLAHLAARLPYEEAREVYEDLTRQKTGRMTIHRTIQKIGKKMVKESPVMEGPIGKGKKHVSADGVLVHIREEGWKEVQVGAVYHVNDERETEEILYATRLGNRLGLGNELYCLSGEPEFEDTGDMAFVSDAGKWLDEMQELHFPLATRIIDQWHVRKYIWGVANQFYEPESRKAKEWGEARIRRLKQGKREDLKRSFSHLKPRTREQWEVLKDTKRYFRNHGHKMDYPRYERMGLHIGSEIVEGACKHVIQSRFKRAGMRWSRKGAENLLALRTLHVNNKWDFIANYQRN